MSFSISGVVNRFPTDFWVLEHHHTAMKDSPKYLDRLIYVNACHPEHCRKLAEATLLGPLALFHGFKFAQTGLQEGQRELDTVAVQAAQEAATSAVRLRCRQEEEEE